MGLFNISSTLWVQGILEKSQLKRREAIQKGIEIFDELSAYCDAHKNDLTFRSEAPSVGTEGMSVQLIK